MPPMAILGRRWLIGSDDLAVPFAVLTAINTTLAILYIVCISVFASSFRCTRGGLFGLYYVADAVIFIGLAITGATIVHYSLKGTILDATPRRPVRNALYVYLGLVVCKFAMALLGLALFVTDNADCLDARPAMVSALEVITILNIVLIVIMLIGVCCVYDPMPAPVSVESAEDNISAFVEWRRAQETRYHDWWLMRLRFLFRQQQEQDALRQTARLLADYFGDVDVTPTDIAAGLVLAMDEQRLRNELAEVRRKQASPSTTSRTVAVAAEAVDEHDAAIEENASAVTLNELPPESVQRAVFMEAAHYCKYAEAIYGWPLYLNTNILRAPTPGRTRWGNHQLLPSYRDVSARCCGPTENTLEEPRQIQGDNCCGANMTALRATAQLEDAHILFATFENELFHAPYFIAVDHETRAIVVAVRGTLSFADALVDMQVHEVQFMIDGLSDCWAHAGFMKVAENTKTDLVPCLQRRWLASPELQSYELVVVGHSLGAGIASLLALLLRPMFPKLRCFAYSPPGCVMSENAAKYAEQFVVSVTLGDDIVARLGRRQLESAKDHLFKLMAYCPTNKTRVLLGAAGSVLPRRRTLRTEEQLVAMLRMMDPPDDDDCTVAPMPSDDAAGSPTSSLASRDNRRPLIGDDRYRQVTQSGRDQYRSYLALRQERPPIRPMYPAGRLLHVVRVSGIKRIDGAPHILFVCKWAHRQDFAKITMSSTMLTDHLPDKLSAILHDLAREYPSDESGAGPAGTEGAPFPQVPQSPISLHVQPTTRVAGAGRHVPHLLESDLARRGGAPEDFV